MPIDQLYALGPEGTFSDRAARRFARHLAHTGEAENVAIVYTRTIPEALELAAKHPDGRAVAPIENSDAGTVAATQDHLSRSGLFIDWEISVRIRLSLISDVPFNEVRRLYGHPVALEQCNVFVTRRLAGAETMVTQSNADSALCWSSAGPEERAAAIVPWDYAPSRAPAVQFPDIQNDERNTTRFLVLRAAGKGARGDFTRAKTSLLIEPDADRPGLLFELLSVFKQYDTNLCRIESRPARTHPWAYVFYLDITNNKKSEQAVKELSQGPWNVVLLGTYDPLGPAE